ncbi:MAG TPA: hypothetical protein VMN60_00280 [Longimicrobiales bacterium]|nr:hypothetical protein [Longimicrobiales bacterium]
MSLLSIRRERREEHRGPNRPANLWKLLVGLAIVAVLFWYLGRFG